MVDQHHLQTNASSAGFAICPFHFSTVFKLACTNRRAPFTTVEQPWCKPQRHTASNHPQPQFLCYSPCCSSLQRHSESSIPTEGPSSRLSKNNTKANSCNPYKTLLQQNPAEKHRALKHKRQHKALQAFMNSSLMVAALLP